MVDHLGIEITAVGEGYVCGRMPVDHRTHQPMGLLHGGASVALAESLASMGAALQVDLTKKACIGLEINANHIRSVREGCRDMLRSERRILVEYPFGSFSGGEIVENNRYGDARASEANRPMHDLRIAADVEFPVHHSTLYVSEPI